MEEGHGQEQHHDHHDDEVVSLSAHPTVLRKKSLGSQVPLLLWKNYRLKKRHVFSTLSEILLPLLFVLLVVWLQTLDKDKDMPEMAYTCPRQSSISPTLLFPTDPDEHKEFIFELDTDGFGPGIMTVPPFPYLMMIASKLHYVIGLAPNEYSEEKMEWLEEFREFLDKTSRPFQESGNWRKVSEFTNRYLGFGFCSFKNISKIFNSAEELKSYLKSDDYGDSDSEWDPHHYCPSEAAMEKPKLHIALILNKLGKEDGDWDYTIQTNFTVIPNTYPQMGLTNHIESGVNELYLDQYMMSGFLTLQQAVDRFIINKRISGNDQYMERLAIRQVCDTVAPLVPYLKEIISNRTSPFMHSMTEKNQWNCTKIVSTLTKLMGRDFLSPFTETTYYVPNDVRMTEFPTPEYTDRPFYLKIRDVFALELILAFLWPISRLIRGIVQEKESKLREGMRMMGLDYSALFIAWFVTYGFIFFVIAFVITVMTQTGLFSRSDPLFIFLYFFLFGMSIITYCFLISVLFSRAKTASTAGVVLFFMGFFGYFGVSSDNASASSKGYSCILSPTAFGLGASILADYEGGGQGITWSTIFDTPNDNSISFAQVLTMLLLDTLLYMFLAFYFDNVIQQEFGVKKPWNFLCMRRYWSSNRSNNHQHKLLNIDLATQHDADPGFFERPSVDLRHLESQDRCIKLNGLTKVFASGKQQRIAVDHMDLTMYEGQVFALLGTNGAGKSTTIGMLSGLIGKSSGDATLFGMDIETDMDDIRQTLGVCPQHNVLWDDLSVREHLAFFASLKNVPDVDAEVDKFIEQVALVEKQDVLARNLSGGQKRKLSVAIALLGDSKVVFLDEPTAGVDPNNRRNIWNMIRANTSGRVIILTTHFMDEAELLGDRIGIMADGHLKCCGTSLFLKGKYGVGYTLTFVLGGGGGDDGTTTPQTSRKQDNNRKRLKEAVIKHIADAKIVTSVGAEVTVKLPFRSSAQFPALFSDIDARKTELQISSYGISVTTLEEVFLKIAEDRYESHHQNNSSDGNGHASAVDDDDGDEDEGNVYQRMSALDADRVQEKREMFENIYHEIPKMKKFAVQFTALLTKRYQYAKRDGKSLCCNILLPILLLTTGLSLLKAFPLHKDPPALRLDLEHYEQEANYVPFNISGDHGSFPSVDFHSEAIPIDAVIPNGLNNSCALDPIETDIWDGSSIKGLSKWLLEHQHDNKTSLYGAVQFDKLDFEQSVEVTVLANSSSLHGPGVFMNLVNQALLRMASGAVVSENANISTTNRPFPLTAGFNELLDSLESIDASMSIVIAFSFVPASVAIYVVKEREISAKHQQLISGASITAYWISNYVWDMLIYLIPWTMSSFAVYMFDLSAYRGTNFVAVVVLFFLYGLAVIPWAYLVSFAFESHSTAQNVVLLLCFITGLVLLIVAIVMSAIESTMEVNRVLKYFYKIFPGFCLGNGLFGLTLNSGMKQFLPEDEYNSSPFDWDVAGSEMFYLLCESVVYFCITVIVDHMHSYPLIRARLERFRQRVSSFFCCIWSILRCKACCSKKHRGALRQMNSSAMDQTSSSSMTTPLISGDMTNQDDFEGVVDEDVFRERNRVDNNPNMHDVIVVRHIRKVYQDGKVAVRGLTFGVPRGECFGFLGTNGAGKTTTIKCLTGDILPTSGTAQLVGFDIMAQQNQLRRRLGYCAQFDATLENLTVREHLELYARIKCIPESMVASVAQDKIRELNLEEYHDKLASQLSGGNRRKLSLAIAMVGSPPLIFLDEPSAGIDPSSRRFMWDVIARLSSSTSVVLTTHSMEECEALCSRVGIMVAGQFVCLGPIQHLKSRFGEGLVLSVKFLHPKEEEIQPLAEKVQRKLAMDKDAIGFQDSDLQIVCELLGDPSRLDRISPSHPTGSMIHLMIERNEGMIDLFMFVEWWLAENLHDQLAQFLQKHFENVECLETRGLNAKWRIHGGTDMSLGDIFSLMERGKQTLNIDDHSIGQTSLEQIFVAFAQKDLLH